MPSNIRREVQPNGICVLTFDRPDSPVNIFDDATFGELNAHLDFVEAGARDGGSRA